MTLYLGSDEISRKVSSDTVLLTNGFDLFDSKWSDHILNDVQWLRSETFSWQDGEIYTAAYQKLAEERTAASQAWFLNNVTYTGVKSEDKSIIYTSTTGYAQSNAKITIPAGQTWEIVFKTKSNGQPTTNTSFAALNTGETVRSINFYRAANTRNISMELSSGTNSFNIASATTLSTTSITNDSEYVWIKAAWDGSNYTLSTSRDGITYTQEDTLASTTAVGTGNAVLNFGADYKLTNNNIGTYFDMSGCYVKVSNEQVWKGSEINYISPNGFRFSDDETLVSRLFTETGVAWFYIIDLQRKMFKLPRTKFGFKGIASAAGHYYAGTVPAHKHQLVSVYEGGTGTAGGTNGFINASSTSENRIITNSEVSYAGNIVNASEYQDGAPVQSRATEMYLYFFVGNTVRDSIEVDLGKVTEMCNDYELTEFDATVQQKTEAAETQIDQIVQDAIDTVNNAGTELKNAVPGNIGDIKYTLRKGLAPYGGVWCDGSVYTKTQYPDIWTLITDGKLETIDIDTYNSTVTLNGSCGFIGVDTTNETFKVPTLSEIYLKSGTTNLAEFGAESLPDHIHTSLVASNRDGNPDGGRYYWRYATTQYDTTGVKENSVYQEGAKVNPDHITYRAYIILFSGQDITSDIHIETQLNNPFSLLDYKWSEYELNNASWLLSNGAFHSNSIYPAVYDLLYKIQTGQADKSGISVKLSTETYTDYDFVLNTTDNSFRLPIRTKDDYIIESYNDDNGNWYKIYKSGWVEQGGKISGNSTDGSIIVTLIKSMSNTNYTINFVPCMATNTGAASNMGAARAAGCYDINLVTVNSFSAQKQGSQSEVRWSVLGQGAESPTSKTYFYVGETIQDANLINAGNALSNAVMKNSSADRETVINWGMPDYDSGLDISGSLSAINSSWVAPKSGIIIAHTNNNDIVYLFTKPGKTSTDYSSTSDAIIRLNGENYVFLSSLAFVNKSQIIYASSNETNNGKIYFYPFKGV